MAVGKGGHGVSPGPQPHEHNGFLPRNRVDHCGSPGQPGLPGETIGSLPETDGDTAALPTAFTIAHQQADVPAAENLRRKTVPASKKDGASGRGVHGSGLFI
ncbi:hypothetical protein BBF93_10530 [Hyphomonas sp. CACIAM 19H1]|nr:hypothetical protein BBF93_10530 [Hyphomonas sp. CACIAM 19H1]